MTQLQSHLVKILDDSTPEARGGAADCFGALRGVCGETPFTESLVKQWAVGQPYLVGKKRWAVMIRLRQLALIGLISQQYGIISIGRCHMVTPSP